MMYRSYFIKINGFNYHIIYIFDTSINETKYGDH